MRGARTVRVMFAAVVIAAAGFAVHRFCAIPFRDNLVMRDVEERMGIMGGDNSSQTSFRMISLARENLADLDRVARSRRRDPAWYMLYGANCEILDRWQKAADAYTSALAIDQRPEIYFSRGFARLRLGRVDQAVADMIMAVRFNPFFLYQLDGELRARVEAGLS